MTYAWKGDKIFSLPDKLFPDCSLPKPKRSDGRLKRFSSIYDDRVWSAEERERYRYLHDLMSGSQTCVSAGSTFRYVPLEALVKLLLADRDAYIKCLENRLGISNDSPFGKNEAGPSGVVTTRSATPQKQQQDHVEPPINELFKAGTFVDDEELDAVAMKNKIASLTAELEECKRTRDTLRETMHKLEDIDDIVNENNSLKARLRCSEEMIKYLEEKKNKLEKELENLRTKSQIRMDLEEAQEMLQEVGEREKAMQNGSMGQLAEERDHLQKRVEELQLELRQARSKQSEMELLRKQSESASLSLEEMTRENEIYKRKLASMKDLEKQIEELKRQAGQMADKYKRDSIKASDQDRQMKDISWELNQLREERDRLRRKVDELACYEQQYKNLQCKLRQVDSILAENAALNSKLAHLDKLEAENEHLKCKLEQYQTSEMEATENKDKITELENAVADQEEEMKDLLCQIERLTRTYGERSELDRLKEELCKKECKLRLCEEQLAEIPLLEAEIDELRSKLENCYNNITEGSKSKGEEFVSGNEEATMIDAKYEEQVVFEEKTAVCSDVPTERIQILEKTDNEKAMTCEEVQDLLQSSKSIITCVLEDMIEHQKEMEELEKCNREMKDEIGLLKARMGKTDMDDFFKEMSEMRKVIHEKERKICCLEGQMARNGNLTKVNEHITSLEREIDCLKDLNRKMRADLREACCEVRRCAELERLLEEEKKARCAAEAAVRQGESRTKSQKEVYNIEAKESSTNDIEALKSRIECLNDLVEQLKGENAMLKKSDPSNPNCEQVMEEKAALENLLNLLQCELDTCREDKNPDEMKALRCELDRLKDQNCRLRSLVNCYKERLELERCSKDMSSKRGASMVAQEENKKLRADIARMQNELIDMCNRLDNCERRYREKSSEFDQLLGCYQNLAIKNDEMEKLLSCGQKGAQAPTLHDTFDEDLENCLARAKGAAERVTEATAPAPGADYNEGLQDKEAIESTMRNVEAEVDGLSMKLEEQGKVEQERNDLLKKQSDMEAELNELKMQLAKGQGPDYAAGKVGAREDKLLEEMVGMREQAEQAKAENKKLMEETEQLKKLLEQCKKPKTDKETQTSLMESKQEGISYPVQQAPQSMVPIKKEEIASELERVQEEKKQEEDKGAKEQKAREEEEAKQQEKARRDKEEKDRKDEKAAKAKDDKDGKEKPKEGEKAGKGAEEESKEGREWSKAAKGIEPKEGKTAAEGLAAAKGERPEEGAMAKEGKAALSGISSDESVVSFSDVDPGFAKFVCSLNPFDHKENVCEIERRYQEMMTKLKQKNDNKVKRLVEQHKKESAMKDKAFNENISSMRSGYESDIRKLVDRHKESILRLQKLHEDEIWELNKNYERQMQAMQTQNENIVSDVSLGAAKKFEEITEQHNRDLKELEEKYQRMLEEKEDEHARTIGGSEGGSEFEKELSRLKKLNLKKVDIMQQKYEKLLNCERKKYERQLEETIKKLKEGKGVAHGVCQCRFPVCDTKDPTAPLEFSDILQKILRYGLESLSFNEVSLVHRRTCAATGGIVLSTEMKQLPVEAEDDPDRDILSKAHKDELLNRILALENEIAIRQTETQDAIVNMELAVKEKRQRLQVLKESLRQEQGRKSTLPRWPTPSMTSTPRQTPAVPKPGGDLPYMPPIRIEDMVPGSCPTFKPPAETQSSSGRGQVFTDNMREPMEDIAPLAAEKDTTKAKHRKSSGKDSKTKYKVTSKKKGKK